MLTDVHSPGARRILMIRQQPRPTDVDVNHTFIGGGCVTAVMRAWKPGDAAHCRLCPRSQCTAAGRDRCLVAVPEYVDLESAPLLSLVGRDWLDPGDGVGVDPDGLRHGAGA